MRAYPKDPLKRIWKTTHNGIVINDWENCVDTPVLFLDIDGVLNDTIWSERYIKSVDNTAPKLPEEKFPVWYSQFCNVDTVWMLKEWLDKTGAALVLTSSWRNTYDIWLTFANLSKEYGFSKLFPYIIGQTCRFNTKRKESWIRGDEIQAWIDEFHPVHYVIVDDDCDVLSSQLTHFVHINPYTGLTKDDLEKIEDILKI